VAADTRGDLLLTWSPAFDLELSGASGDDQTLRPLAIPESYYSTTLHDGVPMNVAEVYVRLARDLREGTSSCPSFDDAVVRHKMLEAVTHASEPGVRQCL
jgi:predicted dehydrogenase